MQRLKIYQRQYFLLFFSFCSITSFLSAQPNLPILDLENQVTIKKDLTIIPESRFGKQFYYLPEQLMVKKNAEGVYMFSMMKYVGESKSGTILNVHFSFKPKKMKSTKIQEILSQNRPEGFYMGAYPFYHHKKFYGQFENIDLIMELVEGSKREEFWRHKAALTTTGLVFTANLPKDKSDLIWNTITQNRRQTIEFKIEVQTSNFERVDDLSVVFAPLKIKEHLLSQPDSSWLNRANFEKTIQLMLNEQEENILQVNGDSELYEVEKLNKIIIDKIAEILFESNQKYTLENQVTNSQIRKRSRKVTINGKVVEQESTTENANEVNSSEPKNHLQFKADENLSSDLEEYYLGEKRVSYQSYPLYFSLSDFYRDNQTSFKEN
ncbi:MAG: hypothetical protein ACI85O_000681 [Saprospiraceae bacterium]|jgi:hypothetical protein